MNYLNNPWKPVRYTFFQDDELADRIYDQGFARVPFLEASQLIELQDLYDQTHSINDSSGGFFVSVYSQDIVYRRKIHDCINEILQSSFQRFFKDYRVVMNSFIIKASGPKSEFYVHQDTTGLDETQYSCLSIWTPLHDIDENNGAVCILPKSHTLFSPYRGGSFKFPFDNIAATVKKYLQPVSLKAGEALFFDNRLVHNSLPNNSGKNRVVVSSGIFPHEAAIVTCYKKPGTDDIELIEHEDSFLLDYPKFLTASFDRPDVGKTIGFVKDEYSPVTEREFEELCLAKNILPYNLINWQAEMDCNFIQEPLHQEQV